MDKITKNSPESKSQDIKAQNIEQLKALFPEAVTEGRIDFEVLKQLLGGAVDERAEKYGLNWHGKRTARQLGLTPSTGTLRPCPGESVDWDKTQNLMIEGDNLEVLKLLQKSYSGKVKLIYIDPPYNTGKDFVYPDNFQDNIKNYLELTGQVEGGKKITSNPETNGRFHTDWLNMMYPRLMLARNLLREDGVIFISIGCEELHNLLSMMNEVFGEECYRNTIIIRRGIKSVQAQFETVDALNRGYEFVVFYSKSSDIRFEKFYVPSPNSADDEEVEGSWNNHWRGTDRPTMRYELLGRKPSEGQWRWAETRSLQAVGNWDRLCAELGPKPSQASIDQWVAKQEQLTGSKVDLLRLSSSRKPEHYVRPSDSRLASDLWMDIKPNGNSQLRGILGGKFFDTPKSLDLLQRIIEFTCADGGLVLDFFAGSGTTGHAVFEVNKGDSGRRSFILVQLDEPVQGERDAKELALHSISDITKERLRRAGKKIREENPLFPGDTGFRVFKLDTSNIRAWDPNYDDVSGSIGAYIEHLESKRTEADILYELLLKLGLDLCVPIERRQIAGKDIYSVGGGVLITCLAATINGQEGEAIALGICSWRAELDPAGDTTCVFRDAAFDGDVTKTNVVAILAQHGIHTVRSL